MELSLKACVEKLHFAWHGKEEKHAKLLLHVPGTTV